MSKNRSNVSGATAPLAATEEGAELLTDLTREQVVRMAEIIATANGHSDAKAYAAICGTVYDGHGPDTGGVPADAVPEPGLLPEAPASE